MFANEEVKFMIKSKVLVLTGVFCTVMGFTVASEAQVNPELRLQNSGSVGYIPTHTRPITSNVTKDLTTSGVTLSDEKVLSTLGCGALDNHQARLTILNTDDSTLNEYFNTSVSNYMVATLYNSPAVAQIFNGLENFSGSRVRELQDRCAAMEYKDDMAAAQWQSVQNCIQSYMNQQGSTSAEVTAQAFKFCLSSPDYTEQTNETLDKSLFEATQQVLESSKWDGSLYSALQYTSICVPTTSGRDCSLLALLPNIRWCTHSNTAGLTNCGDGADTASLDTAISASSKVNISPESISPIQLFDWGFGITEGFTNYASAYARTLVDMLGLKTALKVANYGENKTGTHVVNYATDERVVSGDLTDGNDWGPGTLVDAADVESAYGNFVNCSAPADSTGILEWEDFNDIVAPSAVSTSLLPPEMDAGTIYGDDINADFGVSHSLNSDSTVTDVNVQSIHNIVEYAVKCSLRDDIRLTLSDYIVLTNDAHSLSSDAALLGYQTQVAYMVTKNILNFLIDRLRLAQVDLGMVSSTDRNAPPPYVRNALDTLIESFTAKLDSFEAKRQHQKDYAKVIAGLHNQNVK